MAIAVIALSLGAINMLIPIIVIIILIAAAGASMRGYDIFNVFGVAALMGVSTRGTMAKQNPLKTGGASKFRGKGKTYTMVQGKTAGKLNAYAKRQKAAKEIRKRIEAGAAAGAAATGAGAGGAATAKTIKTMNPPSSGNKGAIGGTAKGAPEANKIKTTGSIGSKNKITSEGNAPISGAPVKEKAGRRFIKQAVVLTTGYGLHSAQRVAQKGEKAKAKVEKLDYKQNKVESKIASSADLSKKDKVEKLAEKRKKVLEKTLKENEKYAEKKEIIEHITEKEKSIPIIGRFVYNPNKYTARDEELLAKSPVAAAYITERIKNASKREQLFRRIDNAKQNAKLTDDENAVIEKIRNGATASDLSEKEVAALKGLKGKPGEASKIASNVDTAMAINEKIKELDRRIDPFINKKIQELSGLDKASEEYNKKMKDINKEIMLRLKAEEKAKSSYQYKSVAPEIKRRVGKEKASSKEESKLDQTMKEIEDRLKEEQRKEEERKKKEEEQKKAEGQGK